MGTQYTNSLIGSNTLPRHHGYQRIVVQVTTTLVILTVRTPPFMVLSLSKETNENVLAPLGVQTEVLNAHQLG